MKNIEEIIKNTTDKNVDKTNWTKAWSKKYPILNKYQSEVDITYYKDNIHTLLNKLQKEYGYNKQDAMLVLKDILYHEYKENH